MSINITSDHGSIGRFNWQNSYTRRDCTGRFWMFWGELWWDNSGEACDWWQKQEVGNE